jgi:hypothetical protein
MAQKIGSQHGVVAGANRLRSLDPGGTLLKRNIDGSWPDMNEALAGIPVDQWKAWDKWQRSFQILVQDHDASLPSNGDGGNGEYHPTRNLSLVQNVLILADDPYPALQSPTKYKIWITADLGYRHIYEDRGFINQARGQGRKIYSWCDCKVGIPGVSGTDPQVAIDMANEYGLDGACGEGEHSIAFEAGYNAGMRVFVVNMSALTQAQLDLINADGETVVTAELYLNKEPNHVVDWKNCEGVGSNCGATYGSSAEGATATPIDAYANYPNAVYPTMSWYAGGNPKPDFARLP